MRGALLVVLCGCGRLGFDAGDGRAGDGRAGDGHDEDGDGVPDAFDVCPFIADPGQLDRDGDHVGDVCDPEPTLPRQRLSWFATMDNDTPCTRVTSAGAWSQTGDEWTLTGGDVSSISCHAVPIRDTDIWIGADLFRVTGRPVQFAIDVEDTSQGPFYYADLYDDGFPIVGIIYYDRITFTTLQSVTLPGVHAGAFTDHLATRTAATGAAQFAVTTGWPAEPYMASAPTPGFAGTDGFLLNLQHLDLAIRYIAFIETTP